ncbi:hypothetical protein C8J57DRAFT_1247570 [Mycena rebaudengoi]|nr:hypothetical protein C8J57DRAFT_1247570 [Mycena rebaudengoi]
MVILAWLKSRLWLTAFTGVSTSVGDISSNVLRRSRLASLRQITLDADPNCPNWAFSPTLQSWTSKWKSGVKYDSPIIQMRKFIVGFEKIGHLYRGSFLRRQIYVIALSHIARRITIRDAGVRGHRRCIVEQSRVYYLTRVCGIIGSIAATMAPRIGTRWLAAERSDTSRRRARRAQDTRFKGRHSLLEFLIVFFQFTSCLLRWPSGKTGNFALMSLPPPSSMNTISQGNDLGNSFRWRTSAKAFATITSLFFSDNVVPTVISTTESRAFIPKILEMTTTSNNPALKFNFWAKNKDSLTSAPAPAAAAQSKHHENRQKHWVSLWKDHHIQGMSQAIRMHRSTTKGSTRRQASNMASNAWAGPQIFPSRQGISAAVKLLTERFTAGHLKLVKLSTTKWEELKERVAAEEKEKKRQKGAEKKRGKGTSTWKGKGKGKAVEASESEDEEDAQSSGTDSDSDNEPPAKGKKVGKGGKVLAVPKRKRSAAKEDQDDEEAPVTKKSKAAASATKATKPAAHATSAAAATAKPKKKKTSTTEEVAKARKHAPMCAATANSNNNNNNTDGEGVAPPQKKAATKKHKAAEATSFPAVKKRKTVSAATIGDTDDEEPAPPTSMKAKPKKDKEMQPTAAKVSGKSDKPKLGMEVVIATARCSPQVNAVASGSGSRENAVASGSGTKKGGIAGGKAASSALSVGMRSISNVVNGDDDDSSDSSDTDAATYKPPKAAAAAAVVSSSDSDSD